MSGFFGVIFDKKHNQAAVNRLQFEVARTSDRAIVNANALSETIKGMIDRKQQLGSSTNGPRKRT